MYKLPLQFNDLIERALLDLGADFDRPQDLAAQILELSDFYLSNPGSPTPWDDPSTTTAYLSYFLPLNFIRLKAVFREVRRFLSVKDFTDIWDFGAGIGTTQWVLESEEELAPRPFFVNESSTQAKALYKTLLGRGTPTWKPQFVDRLPTRLEPLSLGVFSYSFLEMQNVLPKLESFSHLLIVEPSTRDCGRSLMAWRDKLMRQGFFPLAPCTHSEECPLLVHSGKDWCHMRVHFTGPLWWQRIEEHLPMKNRTLTYSYLLMSKTVRDTEWRGAARVIGDTLVENGKTRQMICRGSKREFLSWLHKKGEAPSIPHGSLLRGVDIAEVRGAELRPEPGSLKWTI